MWRKYYVPLQTDIELGGALTITYIERDEGRAEIIPNEPDADNAAVGKKNSRSFGLVSKSGYSQNA